MQNNKMSPLKRAWFGVLAVAAMLLPVPGASAPLPKGFSRAPVPAWVEPSKPDLLAAEPGSGAADGRQFLLIDRQTRFDGLSLVDYRKLAIRTLNIQGVEQTANVQIDFDPSFQRLVLHSLQVHRAGRVIDHLEQAHIRLLQREQSLESLVLSGDQTAHIVLKDVRVGDVVEYSFSRQGSNPALQKQLSGGFELQWAVPVEQLKARLLWPQAHALHWRQHAGAAAPTHRKAGEFDEYRWDLRRVPALLADAESPGWHDGYPWAQWSVNQNWQSVAAWAEPLYSPAERLPASVQRVVNQIAAQHSEPEQRLLAAMRFVQSEIRYLAIALGSGSYVPSPPDLVLQRRFGDCKDKTLLALSLLKGLGIDARAALVHTNLRRGIARWLPSPAAFNHVIVQARLKGQAYWLDATRAPQSGQSLAHWVQADQEQALVVDASSKGLQAMGPAQAGRRQVHLLIDGSAGFDEPASITVRTTVEGLAAESLRAALANNSREQLQKAYLNFYAGSYVGLEMAAPMEVRDEPELNRVHTVEHYTAKTLWSWTNDKQRREASILTPDLNELLQAPKTQVRTAPLALRHPIELHSVTELRLPEAWGGRDEPLHIQDPAFELRRDEQWLGQTVRLTDHYRSLSDHVAAADVERYASNLERARQGAHLVLYKTDGARPTPGESPHWLPMVVGTLTLLLLGWGARQLYRWDPEPPTPTSWAEASAPRGLGGWLLLPTIGLPVKLVMLGKALADAFPAFGATAWAGLTQPDSGSYNALWLPYLLITLVGLLSLLALSLLNLALLLQRRSSLPRLYLLMLGLSLALLVLDRVAFATIPGLQGQETQKEMAEAYRSMLLCVIWSAYFLRSKRVKATFVQRLKGRPQVPAPLQAAGG